MTGEADAFESLTREPGLVEGLSAPEVRALRDGLADAARIADPEQRWAFLSRHVLKPSHPDALHERLFDLNYWDRDPRLGPPPAWIPPADVRERTNLGRLLDRLGFATIEDLHAWSLRDRGAFWQEVVRALPIRFDREPDAPLDLADGPERPRWFPGGRLNIARSCFEAAGDAFAVVEHSEDGTRRTRTYAELERLAHRVARGLVDLGLRPGDAVGILMPLTIESTAALLGILEAGCVAVGIAESFAPPEIALRTRLGRVRLVLTQDRIHRRGLSIPLYAKLAGIPDVPAVVVPRGEEPLALRAGDRTWDQFLAADDRFDALSREPSDHTILLFSSGTTGEPKVIPWTHTTPIKCASDAFLYHDVQPGDVVAWPSSPGWMMGPWLVFAALVNRATIALFDGHPASEGFCAFVAEAGVTMLGLVPSLVRAWRENGWPEANDWTRIRAFSSSGECSNPSDMRWLMARAGYAPVIEYCGGTEIGGGFLASTRLRPNVPSCFNAVTLGLDVTIRDEAGRAANRGELFVVGPSIGLSTELVGRDHHAVYFADTPPGPDGLPLRRHGDQVERLPGGLYRVLGRVDDTMNLGGIKVSAVEIETVLDRHPDVRESAAVVAAEATGGPDRLVAYVVPAREGLDATALRRDLQARIAGELNPLFRLGEVVLVESLPRTASNKLMRRLLRVAAPAEGGADAASR